MNNTHLFISIITSNKYNNENYTHDTSGCRPGVKKHVTLILALKIVNVIYLIRDSFAGEEHLEIAHT